ncbi:MAG: SOS response-associated peptidase [Bacteroidota bacterium]|jgi:putative SOS response-associated peptidase YedK
MCFSYSVNLSAQSLQSKLNLSEVSIPTPGYFFSGFTHPRLPVIIGRERQEIEPVFAESSSVLQSTSMQWGLIPHWAGDGNKADEMKVYGLNARAESVAEKPMFRDAWKHFPCLVPASGFFEWKAIGKKKEPYYIYASESEFILFAGIYSQWVQPETGEEIKSYSIITTEANQLLSEIHNTKQRMPVIIDAENAEHYLLQSVEMREAMLKSCPEGYLRAHRVSPLASNARVNRNIVNVLQPFSEDYSQTLF